MIIFKQLFLELYHEDDCSPSLCMRRILYQDGPRYRQYPFYCSEYII